MNNIIIIKGEFNGKETTDINTKRKGKCSRLLYKFNLLVCLFNKNKISICFVFIIYVICIFKIFLLNK